MAIVLESTQTTTNLSTQNTVVALPTGVSEDDLILIIAGIEGSATFNTPTGYTLAVTEQAIGSIPLCRLYVFYKIAGAAETNPTVVSNSATRDKRFIVHRISGANTGTPIEIISSGTDVNGVAFPPSYDISGGTLTSSHEALFRVAMCNDNGDTGTFDSTQTFTGHTRRAILTGNEIGAISIQKDSVSEGVFSLLTLDTISVDGGEVDGIAFANIGILGGSGGGAGGGLLLLGVG
jgi:hypothetical protein